MTPVDKRKRAAVAPALSAARVAWLLAFLTAGYQALGRYSFYQLFQNHLDVPASLWAAAYPDEREWLVGPSPSLLAALAAAWLCSAWFFSSLPGPTTYLLPTPADRQRLLGAWSDPDEPPPLSLRALHLGWSLSLALFAAGFCARLLPTSTAARAGSLVLADCIATLVFMATCFLGVQAVTRLGEVASREPARTHAAGAAAPLAPPRKDTDAASATAPATPRAPALPSPGSGVCPGCGAVTERRRCAECGTALFAGSLRVHSVVGTSTYQRTYRATMEDGREVALKEVRFATVPDAATLEAFLREGRLLAAIKHRAIPPLLSAFAEGEGREQRFYLAYRWVDGDSLQEELSRKRHSIAEALAIGDELLAIVDHLHTRAPPIIHRDIKPANIVRRADGSLCLIDFGSARDLTQTLHAGTLTGTVGYMPPEQLAGQVDKTSDVYAVGATLLHLLARQEPWQMMGEDAKLTVPRVAGLPRRVRAVLEKMLAPRKLQRFPSAAKARVALVRASGDSSAVAWALFGAAVAAALIAAALFASSGPPAPAAPAVRGRTH